MEAPAAFGAVESAVVELNAVALGVGLELLMENAGRAVAEEALRRAGSPPGRVVALIGPGNNGGDAAVASLHLRQMGVAVDTWEVSAGSQRSLVARHALERAGAHAPFHTGAPTAEQLRGAVLVIDGLLGVGHGPPLRGPIRSAVLAATESGIPILAIDTPTGLGDPDGLRARWTVALTAPKAEVPADRAGEVIVREIGIPPAAWHETGPGDFLRYERTPARGPGARGGRVVVIGGGPYAGAPALVALAALRCGAERATVVAPGRVAPTIQGFSPDLVVRAAGGDAFAPEFAREVTATLASGPVASIVLGPGAGSAEPTVRFFEELLGSLDPATPIVVDADALLGLARVDPSTLRGRPILATPNAGEFRRLAEHFAPGEDAHGLGTVRRVAAAAGVTVLRKGDPDVLDDGARQVLNRHHPKELAVAGAGDVLSGVLAALLARGLPPLDAGRLGSYWAGEAGHRVVAERGPGLIASDLLPMLGTAGRDGLRRVVRP